MSELYKVVTVWELLGQGCINRYYYYAPENAPTAQEVGAGLSVNLVPELLGCMVEDARLLEMSVEPLLNAGSIYTINYTTGAVGQFGTNTTPPHSALAFSLQPSTTQFRSGRKALPGYSTDSINDGEPRAGLLGKLSDAADALAAGLQWANDEYILPALARYIVTGNKYEIAFIAAAAFKRLSTQNSRKEYTSASATRKPVSNITSSLIATQHTLSGNGDSVTTEGSVIQGNISSTATLIEYKDKPALLVKYQEDVNF